MSVSASGSGGGVPGVLGGWCCPLGGRLRPGHARSRSERRCKNQVIAARLCLRRSHEAAKEPVTLAAVGMGDTREIVSFETGLYRGIEESILATCGGWPYRGNGSHRGKRLSQPCVSSHPVRVVCVTGMPGCGKEEVLAVAKDLGFSIVRMGDVVREEAQRRGLPITDSAVGGMATAEREARGFGIWAERTLPRIRGDRAVVDGLRGLAGLDRFPKALGAALVGRAVPASPKTRHERMLAPKREDD